MCRLESKGELHAKIRGMLKKSDKDMHAADWLDLHYWMLDMKNLESVNAKRRDEIALLHWSEDAYSTHPATLCGLCAFHHMAFCPCH